MAGVRSERRSSGKFQGWFIDHTGKQKFFEGTRSRVETLRIAQRLEDEHRQVKLGYIPLKNVPRRTFADARDEYLAWGMSQGGRGGRPWGRDHTRKRRERLAWWESRLSLERVADLGDSLSRVESALRELHREGRAGKTIANYAETLAAFCDWCVERGYLEADPLKKFKGFDTTPKTQRRAMTREEIQRLLAVAPRHRRLLYEVALMSGLRGNELRQLSPDHLDLGECGLHLEAKWTKNRKQQFLPLPRVLGERLRDNTAAALARYHLAYKGVIPPLIPATPLLYVPRDLAPTLDKDLRAAGIPKYTKAGKLDFHALRVTYINLVIASGANPKEAQTLARHATAELTIGLYGRATDQRLAQAIDQIAQHVLSMSEAEHETTQRVENINSSAYLSGGFKSPLRHALTRTRA
jgi:integrase/recombinase XerC